MKVRVLLTIAAAAALIAGVAMALRPPERAKVELAAPDAAPAVEPSRRSGEMLLMGWARTVSGHVGKYRSGPYTLEIELEDGRKVRYVSDKPLGGRQCVKVRARGTGDAIIVLDLEPPDGPCPERERYKR